MMWMRIGQGVDKIKIEIGILNIGETEAMT
jgi:hypothetical protein